MGFLGQNEKKMLNSGLCGTKFVFLPEIKVSKFDFCT
jgi:hypothetical protein